MPEAPPKEDKPLNQAELDTMFGPPPAPAMSAADVEPAGKGESKPLSQEELDKVMDQAEPGSIDSVAAEDTGAKAGEAPTDIESIPDPEPIPGALTADEGSGGGSRRGWGGVIAAILAVVLLVGAGAGLYFGRTVVMRMVPITKEVYSLLGLGGESLGAGLDIRSVASERVNEGGTEVLAVRGVIANISSIERPVPHLRVALFDANNRVVQSSDAAPTKTRLAPGGEIGFRVPLRDPSPLARRLEVTFIEGTKNPDGASAPNEPRDAPKAETKTEPPPAAPQGAAPQEAPKQQ